MSHWCQFSFGIGGCLRWTATFFLFWLIFLKFQEDKCWMQQCTCILGLSNHGWTRVGPWLCHRGHEKGCSDTHTVVQLSNIGRTMSQSNQGLVGPWFKISRPWFCRSKTTLMCWNKTFWTALRQRIKKYTCFKCPAINLVVKLHRAVCNGTAAEAVWSCLKLLAHFLGGA